MKNCPYCGKWIEDEAFYCKYCHKVIQPNLTTPSAPPLKSDQRTPLPSDYKHEYMSSYEPGKISVENLVNLDKLCRENYEFSERLKIKILELKVDFFQNYIAPTLYQFNFGNSVNDVFRNHVMAINGLYTCWEQILLGISMESRLYNFSPNQSTSICRDITHTVFIYFIIGAVNDEKRFLDSDNEEITNYVSQKFYLIKIPFVNLAGDILRIALDEIDNTKIIGNKRKQSTFYVELLKLIKFDEQPH